MLFATLALSALASAHTALTADDSIITAKKPTAEVEVYIPQEIINPGDAVYDGDELLLSSGDTGKLIWVDLEPGASFPHKSYYIFVWPEGGLDVYNGHDIPYVTGKFGSWKVWGGSWTNKMPNELPGAVGVSPTNIYGADKVLPAGTVLTDGSTGSLMLVEDNAYYIWVDTDTKAKFTHPTWHIFIEADGDIQTIKGQWFPELDGDIYLYGENYMVEYPVIVGQ